MGGRQGQRTQEVPPMSLPIIIRPQAQDEYDESIRWYESQQQRIGTKFEREIQTVISTIISQPDRFAMAYQDIREAPVNHFPFSIYYKLRPNRIVILSIFHQSRDPIVWKSRV